MFILFFVDHNESYVFLVRCDESLYNQPGYYAMK